MSTIATTTSAILALAYEAAFRVSPTTDSDHGVVGKYIRSVYPRTKYRSGTLAPIL